MLENPDVLLELVIFIDAQSESRLELVYLFGKVCLLPIQLELEHVLLLGFVE